MLPRHIAILGVGVSSWDIAFFAGVCVGYIVLELAFSVARPPVPRPRLLGFRYLVTVYVAVLGAQLAAYAFDSTTTLLPPWGVPWQRYYLDPLYGPKTLYGAVIALPVAVGLVTVPWRRPTYGRALACWTPALVAVLAGARVGCFLQGCCYGIRSRLFGIRFAPEAIVSYEQAHSGLITRGSASLPVIPTQAISAGVLVALCVWSLTRLRQGRERVWADTTAAYSAYRFLIEIVRADDVRNFYGPLSTSQWIAAALLTLYGLWRWRRRKRTVRLAADETDVESVFLA